jgi:hypothetical protein
MINSGTILSENITGNHRKTIDSKNNHRQEWAIYPESQSDNLPRWLKMIEETENLKANAKRKR